MARPRNTQISLEDTPWYHCCSRTVRRAFIAGVDDYSGKSYEHRRGWIEKRILNLTDIFAIDVAAYAVMSNHLHLVLRMDVEKVNSWLDKTVVEQWHKCFKGTELTQRFVNGEVIEDKFLPQIKHFIALYRSRLCDISWFMRCLNEPIARQANREDNCTGHFWEGRFKSQALLDEAAVLACMAYVDLNPIRANMAKTPEDSMHTSLRLRIKAAITSQQPAQLMPFVGNEHQSQVKGLGVSLREYLDLVDETGRIIQDGKKGVISSNSEKTLERLNIPNGNWIKMVSDFAHLFQGPVGTLNELTRYCEHLNIRRRHFAKSCQYLNAFKQ